MFWIRRVRRPRESRAEARARADALERLLDRHLERLVEALLEVRGPMPAAPPAAGGDGRAAEPEALPAEVENALRDRYDPADPWYRLLAAYAVEQLARGESEEDVARAIRYGADPASFGV